MPPSSLVQPFHLLRNDRHPGPAIDRQWRQSMTRWFQDLGEFGRIFREARRSKDDDIL